MKTKLVSFLVGMSILSAAGLAQAADVARTNVQSKANTAPVVEVQTTASIAERSQSSGRIVLTADQMKDVTAGHFIGPGLPFNHWGGYMKSIDLFFGSVRVPQVGWHSDPR
jgi:hypothetical protein